MDFMVRIKKLYKNFEDSFMTNHSCLACDREVSDDAPYFLCNDCYKSLNRIAGRFLCVRCGDELNGESMICDLCKDKHYSFDSNHSCFYYNDTAASVVKNFKYSGRKYYAKHIAKLMFDNFDGFSKIDKFVYVPISDKKLSSRGFNQADLISKEISKLTGIPVLDALSKDEAKHSQAGLSRTERLKNLAGTFHLKDKVSSELKNKNILIIDDVFTTGTTLSECAKEINRAKPKSVITLTFAKTKLNSLN